MAELIPTDPAEFPINEDLTNYEVPYFPDEFTEEEQRLISPFFTNLDEPVFVMQNLPPVVAGALCSRYSRSEGGIRTVFLREYVDPIINPEKQKDWESLSAEDRKEAWKLRSDFYENIDFLNTNGSLGKTVNSQKAQDFYRRWLSEFGDDSIAEMGTSVTVCIEGISNIAVNTLQGQRIGVSFIEKSSRYVFFGDKDPNGEYKYVIPGQIRGTELEQEYREVMNLLFDTYVGLLPYHLEHIKELYPRLERETSGSFERSRRAKVFDDLRELLPFSTQTSLGINVSGRSAEQLINRMLSDPNGEVRWWGQQVARELQKVIPSFIERSVSKRGAEQQIYRGLLKSLSREMADDLEPEEFQSPFVPHVALLSHTANPDVEILARFIFRGSRKRSLEKIRNSLLEKSAEERSEQLSKILALRNLGEENTKREHVRFRKPPRAFEAAIFDFDIFCRGGDYRDLWRHRMLSQDRQFLTTDWGYDLESDVTGAPHIDQIRYALEQTAKLNQKMAELNLDASQYAVPFAFLQRFYWTISAREIYWISELRTGPQGRPHYRKIIQDVSAQVLAAAPAVFQGMRTDYTENPVSRRESELNKEKKKK